MQKVFSTLQYLRNKGFFDLLSVNFLTQFLGFGSILLVAKFVTPVELGNIKILQSYTAIFAILAGFGFNAAVLKVCAEDRPDQERAGILRMALKRAGITTAVTLLLVTVLALAGVISPSRDLSLWLIVYACTIPLQVLTSIFLVFLQAQKKIKEMARSQAVIKVQSVILIIISAWLWGFKGFILATIAAYALGLWPFLRQIGLKFLRTPLEQIPAHFMQYAFFSVLANGISQLGQSGDILILDHFTVNRAEIGYYALSIIFVAAASQVTGTVQSITLPYFSARVHDETWFRRQLFLNQTRMALLSIVVAVGVYILAWILVPLVYGPDYSPTLIYLAILLISYVIDASISLVGIAIFSLGFVKYNSLSVIITTPINLIVTFIFLSKFGVVGVAWAQVVLSLVSFCIFIILISIVLRKVYK